MASSVGYKMGHYVANKQWRLKHPQRRYAGKKRYYQKYNQNPVNSKAEWTLSEMTLIVASDRPIDSILAQKIGRSVEAIQIKRSKLKKNEFFK